MEAGLRRNLARAFFASALLMAAVPQWSLAATRMDDTTDYQIFGAAQATSQEMAMPGFNRIDGFLLEIERAAAASQGAAQTDALTPSALAPVEPGARFILQAPRTVSAVGVEIDADGDPQALLASLQALDFQSSSVFKNRISGYLPVNQIFQAAALPNLHFMKLSMAKTRAGAVTSQGAFAMNSYLLLPPTASPGLTGAGVTVGILSDSFNCLVGTGNDSYQDDVNSGDLPSGVNIIEDFTGCDGTVTPSPSGTDEGRAMAQIVYDVAPGTTLAFNTADNGEADFANGIVALAGAGAKVIADDVLYLDEPVFQDGIVAQAVDQVEAQGVSYFSAAGNEGRNSWEGHYADSGIKGGYFSGDELMNFDPQAATPVTFLPITLPPAYGLFEPSSVDVILEWDQPYKTGGGPGSNASMDICITNSTGAKIACTSTASGIGNDPVQIMLVENFNLTASKQFGVQVGLHQGTAPGLVKIIILDDGAGATIDAMQTNSPTIQGHAGAAGAAAVGAAFYANTPNCGKTPAEAESFSSWGGDPILFDTFGVRLATPEKRLKPNFVAPDGVNTSFSGFDFSSEVSTSIPQCMDVEEPSGSSYYPGFFGTSAAAPHAAGVAALLLEAKPGTSPSSIYSALSYSAQDMATPGTDYQTGYGFIRADLALSRVTDTSASEPTKNGGGGAFGFGALLPLLGAAAIRRRRSKPVARM